MKTVKILIVALVFFAAGFLLGNSYRLPYFDNQPAAPEQPEAPTNQPTTVTLLIKFGEAELTEFHNITLQPSQTVLDVLTKVAADNNLAIETKDYGAMGTLVTKIGDKTNGQNNNYWQFFVNDQYAQVSANQYQLQGKEIIEWRYTSDQFN